jgi:hypothetical protein
LAHSLYGTAVPVFNTMLGGLNGVMGKAQARTARTIAFINGLAPAQFEGSATREIVAQAGTPKEKRFAGTSGLLA